MKFLRPQILILIFCSLTVFSGCYYDDIPNIDSIDFEVSFAGDIIPIMNASCNQVGCHSVGGIDPDLTASAAYNELATPDLVDLTNPRESKLYKHLIGTESLMPPAGQLPDAEISLILAWIEQGAINN